MALAKRFKLTFGQGKYLGEFTALLGTIVTGLFFQSQGAYFYLGFTTVFYLLVLGFVIDLFRNPLFRLLNGIPALELMKDDLLSSDIAGNSKQKEAKAVIIKQGKVLLIHHIKEDYYLLPGTSVKQRFSLEKALKLHMQDEYHIDIRLRDEKVLINEHALGLTTEHHFFTASLARKKTKNHSLEKTNQALCWFDVDQAMDLLSNHDSPHPDAIHVMWREFLGLINTL
jgi:ADP-ribose pyrophosphatase YjhB (NUDIX family)